MSDNKALLSYRGRVAQEKQRIQAFVEAQLPSFRTAWKSTKTVRRIAAGLSENNPLIVWDYKSHRKQAELELVNVMFSAEGLVAMFELRCSSGKSSRLIVSRNPVQVYDLPVFLSLDTVEPLEVPTGRRINLILSASAGVDGYWPCGSAIGTEQEYNK